MKRSFRYLLFLVLFVVPCSIRSVPPVTNSVTALSDAHLWIGLKNSDDQGTQFDLYAELLKNGVTEATALKRCITGLTRNPASAKEAVLTWNAFGSVPVAPRDVLSLRVSTRIGTNPDDTKCTPGHNGSAGLRLYYDATTLASRFDMTITPDPSRDFYLHSDGKPCANAESTGVTKRYLDDTAPGAASARCKDSGGVHFTGGNTFSLIGTWSLAPLLAGANVYVANEGFHTGVPPSVTVYAPSAEGNAAPARTIAGPNTNLSSPEAVFVDTVNGELYVADFVGRAIRVFPLNANGNVAPTRELVDGPNSGLFQVRDMVVDTAHDELIVTSFNDSIRVYPRLASGDFPPTRVISGANTLLNNPISLAFDAGADELFTESYNVGGFLVPGILVFNRTDSGNAAPKRAITGSNTQFGTFTNYVTLDIPNGELFAEGDDGIGIVVFNLTDNGNVAPKRNLTGASTGMAKITAGIGGILVDDANGRVITDIQNGSALLVFPRTASGDTTPLMFILGPATGLSTPFGLATDGPGGFTGFSTDATVPQAQSQPLNTAVNTLANFTLTATDPDNTSFVFTIVTPPAHGLIGSYDGSTGAGTYTPKLNYTGPDSFTFTAFDGVNTSAPATVSITVF